MRIGNATPSEVNVSTPAGLSDGEIAARQAAVRAGAVKYLPDLRAFARSLAGNRHQADDLVQSAILRALDAAHQFTPGTNFRAWSFTILRNVFYNRWRSPESRQLQLDDNVSHARQTPPSQEVSLELCDFRRAFVQLAPEQREALMLIASGLEYEEAAKVCGCAVGTVKSRVSRARTTLRDLMDEGDLKLRRREVAPISTVDVGFALDVPTEVGGDVRGPALTLPAHLPQAVNRRPPERVAIAEQSTAHLEAELLISRS